MGQIPVLLLAPVAGIVADRYNRQRIVIATQTVPMVLALTLAALTLTGVIQVWEIMVLATLLGVVNAFDIPARQAFLIDMVGREDLLNAIALNSSMFNGARVIRPGHRRDSGGVHRRRLVLFRQRRQLHRGDRRAAADAPDAARRRCSTADRRSRRLLEGFRFARHTAPVRALLLLVGLVSLAAMPYTVLMPIFAGHMLHGDARVMGLLMGATGVGALFGALTLAIEARRGRARTLGMDGGDADWASA